LTKHYFIIKRKKKEDVMKRLFLLFLIILTFYGIDLFASNLPTTLTIGDSNLVLNGSGIRKKLMFSIYEIGLYLPQKTNDIKAVYNSEKKALKLYFIYKKIESNKIKEAFEDGIALNHKELKDTEEAKKFLSIFNFDVKEKDVIDLYFDRINFLIYYNSKQIGGFTNTVLSKAILDIYLGENPIDKSLKNKLLGK